MMYFQIFFLYPFLMFCLSACILVQKNQSFEFEVRKDISFSADVPTLKGDLYLPKTTDENKTRPAVVVVHGGGWINRTGDMSSICKKLAKSGFVAFDITYRLAPDFHHPTQLNDVIAAVEWLRENAATYSVDVRRFGAWGYSAGAHLALLAGLDAKNGLRALVAGGTPADLTVWPESPLVNKLIGHPVQTHLAQWQQASPVNHVKSDSPPVFLYHGEWDQLVEVDQVDKMKNALQVAKVPVETYRVSFLGHFAVFLLSAEADRRAVDFLKRTL